MRCEEFRKNIELYTLGGFNDIARVAARHHVDSCAGCARDFKEYAGIVNGIRNKNPRNLSESRITAIEAAVREGIHTRNRSSEKGMRLAKMAAIITLMALGGGITAYVTINNKLNMRVSNASSPVESNAWHMEKPSQIWSISCGPGYRSTSAHKPLASQGVVYTLQSEGELDRIVAVRSESGTRLWTGARHCYGHLTAGGGKLFAVCYNTLNGATELVAFDSHTGEELWSYTSDSPKSRDMFTSPIVYKDRVYWAAYGQLTEISLTRGTPNWKQEIPVSGGYAQPCVVGKYVCLGTADGVLYYDAATGSSRGMISFPERMMGLYQPSVAAMDERLYIAHRRINNSGVLLCVKVETEEILWKHESPAVHHMSVSDKALIIRSQSVYALDVVTGKTRWKVDAGGCSPVTSLGECCYVLGSENSGRLLRLDLESGHILGEHLLGGSCAGLVLEGSRGYFNDNKGVLHALDLSNMTGCTAM